MSFLFVGRWRSHPWPCFPCPLHFWPFCFPISFNGSSYLTSQVCCLVPFWLTPQFFPPSWFLLPLNDIRILRSPLPYVTVFLLFVGHFGGGCSSCNVFWVWGMSKLLSGSYLDVLHKDLFFCFVFFYHSWTFGTNLFSSIWPLCRFSKTF